MFQKLVCWLSFQSTRERIGEFEGEFFEFGIGLFGANKCAPHAAVAKGELENVSGTWSFGENFFEGWLCTYVSKTAQQPHENAARLEHSITFFNGAQWISQVAKKPHRISKIDGIVRKWKLVSIRLDEFRLRGSGGFENSFRD